nr:helix-turn-helix domain-containing protein [Leptospiraceae bacterium]
KTLRYSELKNDLPNITHKMLTSQLRELEENGFVDRKVYPVVPPKTEYCLTARGKKCLPVIEALRKYGNELKKELKAESV